jgi:hypothetical protein
MSKNTKKQNKESYYLKKIDYLGAGELLSGSIALTSSTIIAISPQSYPAIITTTLSIATLFGLNKIKNNTYKKLDYIAKQKEQNEYINLIKNNYKNN